MAMATRVVPRGVWPSPLANTRPISNSATSLFFRDRLCRSESSKPGSRLGRSTSMSLLNGFCSATGSPEMQARRFFRNQRLSLRLVQAQAGQNPPRLGNLVMDRIEGVRADRAARRRGGNFSTP